MGGNNNILLTSLQLGPAQIPVGGEDDVAVFTPDVRYNVQQGINGPVFSKVASPTGTIVLTFYATDTANAILRGLVNTDDALQGALPLPGAMLTAHVPVNPSSTRSPPFFSVTLLAVRRSTSEPMP